MLEVLTMKRLALHLVIRYACFSILFLSTSVFAQGYSSPGVLPEKAKRGISQSERTAMQAKLFNKLFADRPANINASSIFIELSAAEKKELAKPQPLSGTPLRIGLIKSLDHIIQFRSLLNQTGSGALIPNANGELVWSQALEAPEAHALRVHFEKFSLPPNARLYLYTSSGDVRGPYTGKGPNRDGSFWSGTLFSESVTVALYIDSPVNHTVPADLNFFITDIAYIGSGFLQPETKATWSTDQCSNAPCVQDASCGVSEPALAARNGTAKIEWISGPYVYTCTGGLLADTDPVTERKLFLTANHCLSSNNNTLETFFNYTTDSCQGTCPERTSAIPATTGATVLATGRKADYTLLELGAGTLPASAVFLGWNPTPIHDANGTELFRVSNPNFGPQVYSEHSVDSSSPTCRQWNRGPRIYSKDLYGATDGGSSGSPVVNNAGQVVGQLSGCCGYNCANVCASEDNWTVDGALANYYSEVAAILNPSSTPDCSTDSDCDDGIFCNGIETCSAGSCLTGSAPCAPGEFCEESTASCFSDGGGCTLGQKGAACNVDADCCSNKCKGKRDSKTCI